MMLGTLKRAIHPLARALAQSSAVVFFISTASGHLVVLSTTVKRCVYPSLEAGNGPTKSTCRCANIPEAAWKDCTRVCMRQKIFPRAHPWQSRHHSATWADILDQINLPKIIHFVARIPLTAEKTAALHDVGTSGQRTPVLKSHSKLAPSNCSLWI